MTCNFRKFAVAALLCLLPAAAWADGAVYAMTNALGSNHILVYHRGADGTLTLIQTVATGGGGGGAQLSPPIDSLGSQGSLHLDETHHRLFAVNTESLAANTQDCQLGTITSFVVAPDGTLSFADRVLSGGLYPVSLTSRKQKSGEVLYVLNAGGPGLDPACGIGPNITGFAVDDGGHIFGLGAAQAIDPGALGGTGSGENCPPGGFPTTAPPDPSFFCGLNPPAFPRGPAEVRFAPDGRQLVVTVKGTNSIYVFPVDKEGLVGTPKIMQARGPAIPTYFGFTFDRKGRLLLTEAFGSSPSIPAPGAGAVSSFTIAKSGNLHPLSKSVGDGGTAACWIALEPVNGQFAYVSNNLSDSISTYSVKPNGRVELVAKIGAPASGPNDLAVASEGGASFLYALNSTSGTVAVFQVDLTDGSLIALPEAGGLPVDNAAQGLAAF